MCQVTREGNYSSELSTVSGALYLVIGASGKMQAEFGKSPGKQTKKKKKGGFDCMIYEENISLKAGKK